MYILRALKINSGYELSELGLLTTVDTALHMKYANLRVSSGLITLTRYKDSGHTPSMLEIAYCK